MKTSITEEMRFRQYLDISSPGEFEYFENMADLFESDYEIDADTLNELWFLYYTI